MAGDGLGPSVFFSYWCQQDEGAVGRCATSLPYLFLLSFWISPGPLHLKDILHFNLPPQTVSS